MKRFPGTLLAVTAGLLAPLLSAAPIHAQPEFLPGLGVSRIVDEGIGPYANREVFGPYSQNNRDIIWARTVYSFNPDDVHTMARDVSRVSSPRRSASDTRPPWAQGRPYDRGRSLGRDPFAPPQPNPDVDEELADLQSLFSSYVFDLALLSSGPPSLSGPEMNDWGLSRPSSSLAGGPGLFSSTGRPSANPFVRWDERSDSVPALINPDFLGQRTFGVLSESEGDSVGWSDASLRRSAIFTPPTNPNVRWREEGLPNAAPVREDPNRFRYDPYLSTYVTPTGPVAGGPILTPRTNPYVRWQEGGPLHPYKGPESTIGRALPSDVESDLGDYQPGVIATPRTNPSVRWREEGHFSVRHIGRRTVRNTTPDVQDEEYTPGPLVMPPTNRRVRWREEGAMPVRAATRRGLRGAPQAAEPGTDLDTGPLVTPATNPNIRWREEGALSVRHLAKRGNRPLEPSEQPDGAEKFAAGPLMTPASNPNVHWREDGSMPVRRLSFDLPLLSALNLPGLGLEQEESLGGPVSRPATNPNVRWQEGPGSWRTARRDGALNRGLNFLADLHPDELNLDNDLLPRLGPLATPRTNPDVRWQEGTGLRTQDRRESRTDAWRSDLGDDDQTDSTGRNWARAGRQVTPPTNPNVLWQEGGLRPARARRDRGGASDRADSFLDDLREDDDDTQDWSMLAQGGPLTTPPTNPNVRWPEGDDNLPQAPFRNRLRSGAWSGSASQLGDVRDVDAVTPAALDNTALDGYSRMLANRSLGGANQWDTSTLRPPASDASGLRLPGTGNVPQLGAVGAPGQIGTTDQADNVDSQYGSRPGAYDNAMAQVGGLGGSGTPFLAISGSPVNSATLLGLRNNAAVAYFDIIQPQLQLQGQVNALQQQIRAPGARGGQAGTAGGSGTVAGSTIAPPGYFFNYSHFFPTGGTGRSNTGFGGNRNR